MNQKQIDPTTPNEDAIPAPGTPSHAEHPSTHYQREDDRWYIRFRLRDWLILLAMIGVYLIWTGVVYLFEPGIR